MHGLLVFWDLSAGSKASFEELRDYLWEKSMPRFRQVEGLRQKTWLSNPETGKWGALYLFESREAAEAVISHLEESPVVAMTGHKPTWQLFDVEAVVEGQHDGTDLLTAGLVWTSRQAV